MTDPRDPGNDPGPALERASAHARAFLAGLPERPVGRPIEADALRATLGGPLPETPTDPAAVVDELAAAMDPGLVGSAGGRYFGFVIGGSVPAALAADWLVSAWDQNAVLYASSPAAAIAEEVAVDWMKELLGLPPEASGGFTTGAGMANMTGLAAARHAVVEKAGWDVERQGLFGAPEIEVVVGDEVHATLLAALQYLGLGRERVTRIPADDQGRMRADALEEALDGGTGPVIVAAQAGNVNTGAIDPLDRIAAAARRRDAWLHIDGAFGLWAAISPELRGLVEGHDLADSWAVDAHKWLNVPYDAGFVAVRDAAAHRTAMRTTAAYLISNEGRRDNVDFVPDFSRRARAVPAWAAIRSLGRDGIRDLVERCCRLARRMADGLRAEPGIEILNDVVLNQILVRFTAGTTGITEGDALTARTIAAIQQDGTLWAGGTSWQGRAALRLSVSGWATTEADIDRSIDAIVGCARTAAASNTATG